MFFFSSSFSFFLLIHRITERVEIFVGSVFFYNLNVKSFIHLLFFILAAKNLSVDNDRMFKMIGTGPDMEELMKKRDGWVQFLYLRLFDWIVSSVNATFSFSRTVM